jgi:hypothetical protein
MNLPVISFPKMPPFKQATGGITIPNSFYIWTNTAILFNRTIIPMPSLSQLCCVSDVIAYNYFYSESANNTLPNRLMLKGNKAAIAYIQLAKKLKKPTNLPFIRGKRVAKIR